MRDSSKVAELIITRCIKRNYTYTLQEECVERQRFNASVRDLLPYEYAAVRTYARCVLVRYEVGAFQRDWGMFIQTWLTLCTRCGCLCVKLPLLFCLWNGKLIGGTNFSM